jgi:hypothetical protein
VLTICRPADSDAHIKLHEGAINVVELPSVA